MSMPAVDKSFFDENGYVVVNNVLPLADLTEFQKTFYKTAENVFHKALKQYPELQRVKTDSIDAILIALRHTDMSYVAMIQRLISRSPEFYRLNSSPKMVDALRAVLGVESDSPLYFLSNGIVFTHPNDFENKRSINFQIDWHQDTFYTLPQSKYIQFWGPLLHESTEEIGTLRLCVGSHKDGLGKQVFHPEATYNYRYMMAEGEANRYNQVAPDLALGQMLIFDGQLIHGSGRNVSNKVRVTLLGLCHDAMGEHCIPVSTEYRYHGQTPESWFYELYGDKEAQRLADLFSIKQVEPVGGI